MSDFVPLGERLRRRAWWFSKSARRLASDPAGRTDARALIVLGCQRSGTTMMVDVLDKDRRVHTFHEYSPVNLVADGARPWSLRSASRWSIRLGPLDGVAKRIGASRFPLLVLKPLVESQHAQEIAARLERGRCLWMYRHYRDVARSNVKLFGAEIHRTNLEPITRRDPSDWRSERVPDDVFDLVSRHYAPDMNPNDGGALFWYARNRLFFDQGLDANEQVMLLRYEDLAAEPERWFRAVYEFAGIEFPGAWIVSEVHPRSVGLGSELDLHPEIAAACERLWDELSTVTARAQS